MKDAMLFSLRMSPSGGAIAELFGKAEITSLYDASNKNTNLTPLQGRSLLFSQNFYHQAIAPQTTSLSPMPTFVLRSVLQPSRLQKNRGRNC
ncbi:MAG: hypothetical protein HXY43_22615 [Fischerella sp.]|jgi:hypothetical protein|uniref:hypothetical protein n=1 Tax=Fischerella sp. TaxID=1191 RepID=UPI0017B88292|nr:hypothetical protein [Fischerella sp.]NWF61966.1 hypothetical protein [Fischerella sp.]